MKTVIVILLFTISVNSLAQTDLPLFAKLIEVKNSAEHELGKYLQYNELSIDTLPKDKQAQRRLENFEKVIPCLNDYSSLKIASDKLILQLKADLTLSNKLKRLRKLQKGTSEMKWYNDQIKEIDAAYGELMTCLYGDGKFAAVGLGDITGVFTAITGLITGGRDARAEKVKSLCSQLDALRLNDVSALGKAPAKEE